MISCKVMIKRSVLPFAFLAFSLTRPVTGDVAFQTPDGNGTIILIDGKPFSEFFTGTSFPKPFLAPLRTASGIEVTRKYPMTVVPGESRDHQHHRGLWIGYGNVSGINFWENEFNYTTANRGKIVLRKIDELKPGKKSGKLVATFEWRNPQDAVMLEERRTMVFSGDANLRTVDVDAALTAKTNVEFEDTKEGFFAIRLADSMAEKNGGRMTSSEGAAREKSVWGKRADWVDYAGSVDGAKVGIVIFDHPGNYNHPPRWHSRAYGLFAVNPFGLKDFEPASPEKGGKSIAPGDSLRFRYRVRIYSGDLPASRIAAWYEEYKEQVK